MIEITGLQGAATATSRERHRCASANRGILSARAGASAVPAQVERFPLPTPTVG